MIAAYAWMAAVLLVVFVAVAAYTVAPGLGVLMFIVGIVALVVLGDRAEQRERDAELEAKRDRLRNAARRAR